MSFTTYSLVNAGIALLIIILAIPMILEKVKPNRLYGFRTPRTLSDPKIWYPANKYAGKVMVVAGIAMLILSAAGIGLDRMTQVFAGMTDVMKMVIWLIVLFVPIGGMLVASLLYLRKL